MRTGSSCRVRQKALKKSTSTHFDGYQVNRCAVHTLQTTKFQAFSALKTKLSRHIDRARCALRTLPDCNLTVILIVTEQIHRQNI